MASDEAGSAGDQNHYCASSQFTGFLLPWGVVRILTWVGAGFFEPNRPQRCRAHYGAHCCA
jgi:hypothetical protein